MHNKRQISLLEDDVFRLLRTRRLVKPGGGWGAGWGGGSWKELERTRREEGSHFRPNQSDGESR